MSGWIKLHRSCLDHWLYTEYRPLTRREAWETILFTVNYEPSKCLIRGQLYDCGRGQSLLSLHSWAEKFVWSVKQVRTFFLLLEKDEMIKVEGLQYTTRLTVCNYDSYQDKGQTEGTPRADGGHTEGTPRATIKEEEEYKEYKKSLLSEIKISDHPQVNPVFFEIAKSFQELFKNNLIEAGASTSTISKAKGTWIDDVRLMIETDKYTVEDMRAVYVFLQNDSFWKQNILSTSTLRKQMPKLKLKIHNNGANKPNSKEATSWNQLANIVSDAFNNR